MIWPLGLGLDWAALGPAGLAPWPSVQMGSDLEVSLLVEPDRAGLGPAEGQRDAPLRMPWPLPVHDKQHPLVRLFIVYTIVFGHRNLKLVLKNVFLNQERSPFHSFTATS